jgi:FkbM family methyltransferase
MPANSGVPAAGALAKPHYQTMFGVRYGVQVTMSDVAEVSFLRSTTERLFGPLVISRHLPAQYGGGKLTVSGKVGGLKYLFKNASDWDPELLRIASVLVEKNDIVWDVGANVGLFAKSAAYLAGPGGHIYAVEADADAQVLLNKSIALHSPEDAPITLLPVAVSDHVGWETFSISRRARASNSLAGYGSSSTGGVLQNRIVPSVTLDSMLDKFSLPNVLKIDVEDAEVKVLEGGKEVLKTVRPLIYCEISSENIQELQRIFAKASYRFFDERKILSSVDMDKTSNGIGFNTIAMPEELVVGLAKA